MKPSLPAVVLVAAAGCLLVAVPGLAHFHMLIPESPAVWPGSAVRLQFFYGHPYEHELLPAAPPAAIQAYPPGGEPVPLSPAPEAGGAKAGDGQPLVHAYSYGVERRGDHVLVARAAPRFEKEHGEVLEAHLKVVVHALSERGWDRLVGQPLEIVPLTRPYGLRPGWVFRGKALLEGKPLEGARVEIERYNPQPPQGDLPEDEFITRTGTTAAGGVFAATLDEAGWWIISVTARHGTRKGAGGKEYPLVVRSTLCVYVGEPLLEKDR
jgi:cobalt/nickel transport protein